MIKRILYTLLIMFPVVASAQINTDRVMAIGRNALYFEDYVLSIQYFNQVIDDLASQGQSLIYVGHFESQLPKKLSHKLVLENGTTRIKEMI